MPFWQNLLEDFVEVESDSYPGWDIAIEHFLCNGLNTSIRNKDRSHDCFRTPCSFGIELVLLYLNEFDLI